MPRTAEISIQVGLPDGVTSTVSESTVTLAKEGRSISRDFKHNRVSVMQLDTGLRVYCPLPRRSERAIAGTWAAHLRNMVKGVDQGFE